MTRINELINDPASIFVFDVDGVLAKMEFGDNNHYFKVDTNVDSDVEFSRAILRGHNFYTDDLLNKTLQSFIEKKDNKKIYVLSRCYTEEEQNLKDDFLLRNYNIIRDNIMYVNDYKDKLEALNLVKKLNPDTDDEHIIMVDDNVDEVLNYIMDNSNYTTVHVSSFM
jgi:hypothetical protein